MDRVSLDVFVPVLLCVVIAGVVDAICFEEDFSINSVGSNGEGPDPCFLVSEDIEDYEFDDYDPDNDKDDDDPRSKDYEERLTRIELRGTSGKFPWLPKTMYSLHACFNRRGSLRALWTQQATGHFGEEIHHTFEGNDASISQVSSTRLVSYN